VLHLGSQKTGTTAVQAWCREHAEELAGHGILSRTTQTEIRAALDGWYDVSRDGADDLLRAYLEAAFDGDGTGSATSLFYSSESNVGPALVPGEPGLYPRIATNLAGIDRATSGLERHVQFTVRSYAPFLESAYLQQLKHGRALTFAQFMAGVDPGYSWVPVVRTLVDVFGADRLAVYDYDAPRPDDAQLVGRILGDAAGWLGAPDATAGADWSHRTNPRYTRRMTDLALAALPLLRTPDERRQFHRFLATAVARSEASAREEPATFVAADEAAALDDRYRADLAHIRQLVEVR